MRNLLPSATRHLSIGAAAARAPAAGGWEDTQADTQVATQFVGEEQAYLADPKVELGRKTGVNQHELFVSCAPALALQQQFEHLQPEFIAVHDIGGQSSRKLLTAIAAASKRSVQRLSIRRQGFGNELVGLAFVELPTLDGTSLRLYSSESNPDDEMHLAVVRMLFAFSRLGVMMVSEPQPETMADRLGPFRAAISNGPWANRQLLMLPLIAGNGVLVQGEEMVRGTGVNVRTTPQVMRPADAWSYIAGTWGRLREHLGQEGRGLPSLEAAPAPDRTRTAPAAPVNAPPANFPSGLQAVPSPVGQPVVDRTTMRPMPTLGTSPAQNSAKRGSLDHYVQRLVELPGMVSCCVFDVASGLEVAHAGASPGAGDLAMHGKALLAGMGASSRGMGLGHTLPEAAITLGSHHLLLRVVPRHPGLALHAVLDKTHANLTLARLQVERMDAVLFEVPSP